MEWAHAIAPGAQIVLVEANSQSLSDLMASVATAANQPGVSVVSMSWGFAEGQSVFAQDEAIYDSDFTTPAGHQGVTFVASTGDYGTADPEYPAFSPNVVAVGGTSLYLNADNSYNSETGWGYTPAPTGTFIGSGGGTSHTKPSRPTRRACSPPASAPLPTSPSTPTRTRACGSPTPTTCPPTTHAKSWAAPACPRPAWAGLFALANQGRTAAGERPSTAHADRRPDGLYSLPQSDFNTITSGTNGGYNAAAGYNLVTGLGSPAAKPGAGPRRLPAVGRCQHHDADLRHRRGERRHATGRLGQRDGECL